MNASKRLEEGIVPHCQVSNEKYDPCPDHLWSLRIAFRFEMPFLESYPNGNLSSCILLTKISLRFHGRSYVSLPLLEALLYNVVVLSQYVLYNL